MSNKKKKLPRLPIAILCTLIVLFCGIGGTYAFLADKTAPVVNKFDPSKVDIDIDEDFDGTIKKNVTATNKGDVDAYIRIKLLTYRVNEAGDPIGGTVTIDDFEPGDGWFRMSADSDVYYYEDPVAPGQKPDDYLIGDEGITLEEYDDADGGKQVVVVMAEAIQSQPWEAVEEAWGEDVANSLKEAAESKDNKATE